MKAVLNKVLEQDRKVHEGTSAYVDDIMMNERVVTAEDVRTHLERFRLESKSETRKETKKATRKETKRQGKRYRKEERTSCTSSFKSSTEH